MDHGMASGLVEAAEEVIMISQSCDFDEFLERVRDRDYLEVIYLADNEAMEDTLHEGLQAFREAALENYMGSAEVMDGSVDKE